MRTKLNNGRFGRYASKSTDTCRPDHLNEHMLVCGHRLPCESCQTANSSLRERFALLLKKAACGAHLGFRRFVSHIMGSYSRQSLAFS